MTNVEILKATKELLSDPKRWTIGKYARNSFYTETSPLSPDAVCFCLSGAIAKVANTSPLSVEQGDISHVVSNAIVPRYYRISDFNDSTDHPTLMATLDRAIASAEKIQKTEG